MNSLVIFGGSGFVGTHLINHLTSEYPTLRITIADIRDPGWHAPHDFQLLPNVGFVRCDVRKPIPLDVGCGPIDAIVNLAAVHTSPGHPSQEYFEANILGARHICDFAEANEVRKLVFTSSISVYGPGEDEKSEESIPMPNIPYGSSKIVAEYIHREWVHRSADRALTILRPGVIYGKYEGGNFTRIGNALRRGFFVFPGRTDTVKACVYIKDVCRVITDYLSKDGGLDIFNVCHPRKTTISDIVGGFRSALGYRAPQISVPFWAVNAGLSVVSKLPIPAIQKMGLVPERIVKLVRSTNISSQKLVSAGFRFEYDLEIALRDWSQDCKGGRLY